MLQSNLKKPEIKFGIGIISFRRGLTLSVDDNFQSQYPIEKR